MKTLKTTAITAAFAAIVALSASTALAQDPAQGGGRRGGGQGGGTPEEFRTRMNERLKTSLKVTDQEWTLIQPLIEKVQAKQREAGGGRGFGGQGGGRRGQGGEGGGNNNAPGAGGGNNGGGDQATRGGSAESAALRAALENEGTPVEELKAKLNAYRDARKKSAGELAQAREELKKVLTVRQEAALVTMGILE